MLDEMDFPARSPSMNMLKGSLPTEAPRPDDGDNGPVDDYAMTHVQGFVNRLTSDHNPHHGKSDQGKQDRGKSEDHRPRHRPDPARSERRHKAAPVQHQGRCNACGRWGHPANKCDMVAMGLFLRRYMADQKNSSAIKESEQNWLQRNSDFLPSNDISPRRILPCYCEVINFHEDQVDLECDWDFFAPDFDKAE